LLQADAHKADNSLHKERKEREYWEVEYHRCSEEVRNLEEEGDKNYRRIKELSELLQHLGESTQAPDSVASATNTLVTVQKDLDTKSGQLEALRATLFTVDADLVAEQINHQTTRDTLVIAQNNLNTANNNLTTALLNTVVVNTQLVTIRQELDGLCTVR